MSNLLTKRDWYISAEMYSELMELYARYAKFGDDSQFLAQAANRFGLRPFTEYHIVVDDWTPRRHL